MATHQLPTGDPRTGKFWEDAWKQVNPGLDEIWDNGGPHLALLDLITLKKIDVKGKTALIPGCGRGHDVIALATHGANAHGVDISTIAIKVADEYTKEVVKDEEILKRIKYEEVDFFGMTGQYDIGYEYTFSSAFPLDSHPLISEKWSQLIKPNGILINILYPNDPTIENGPPFRVIPSEIAPLYEKSFICEYLEPIQEQFSNARRVGKEYLGIWRKL